MPPYLTPLQIFENYKNANPQKCKGKSTIEICRLAGLNDKQIAELKTTSAWLFCFDKENSSTNQDINMTEIFGGNFSKRTVKKAPTKSTPKMSDKDCAQMIYNQIKGISCYWKTEEILKNTINKDNVVGILKIYKDIAKRANITALSDDIDNESTLNYETVKKYVVKSLIQKAKELKIDMSYLVKYDELKNLLNVNEYISLIVALIDKKEEANKNIELAAQMRKKYARPKFNLRQYTFESLKKQYPAPQYKIEIEKGRESGRQGNWSYTNICVKNKKGIVIKEVGNIVYDDKKDQIHQYINEFDNDGYHIKHLDIDDNNVASITTYEWLKGMVSSNDKTKMPHDIKIQTHVEYYCDGSIKYYSHGDSKGNNEFYQFADNGNLLRSAQNKNWSERIMDTNYDTDSGMVTYRNGSNYTVTYHENGMRKRYESQEYAETFSKTGIKNDFANLCYILLQSSRVDFKYAIQEIDKTNVVDIIKMFHDVYNKDLIKHIQNSFYLTKQEKKTYIEKINKAIIQSDFWKENKPNTKFDKGFGQGRMGDCWFLCTVAAIACKPKGLKILNNMITENKDGSYTVKFKGVDKSYTVTPFDLIDNSDYATGDLDARIIEIAADKHYALTGIYGGNPASALDLLLGTHQIVLNLARVFNPLDDSVETLKKVIKDPNTIVTCSVNIISRIGLDESADYANEISYQHGYAVVDIDDKYVYLKNPWHVNNPTKQHAEETFKMPIRDFQKYLTNIQYATMD